MSKSTSRVACVVRDLVGMERSAKMATLRNTAVWTAASTVDTALVVWTGGNSHHTGLPCGRAATAIHTGLPCGRAVTNRPHRLAREPTIRLLMVTFLGRVGSVGSVIPDRFDSTGDGVQRRAVQLDHLGSADRFLVHRHVRFS